MRNKLTVAVALAVCATSAPLTAQDPDLERRIDETVRELGVLESARAVDIRSPLDSTILSIVAQGTEVKQGDLLVGLDTSSQEEEYNSQQVKLHTSMAKVVEAKSRLEAMRIDSQSGTDVAMLAVKVADLALQRFIGEGGELALREKQADAELSVARERVKTAQYIAEFAEARAKAARASDPAKSSAAALDVVEAKENLAVAEAKRKWLDQHVRGHESAALQLALRKAQLELTRGKRDFEQQLAGVEADLQAAEAIHNAEEAKLARLQKQLASGRVLAPRDGIVLYANPRSGRAAQRVPIEEGANVRQRQLILRVVDMKHLQLRVNVHESRINRVRVGQPAIIRFDALLNDPVIGNVVKVSQTPEPTNWFNGNSKEYAVWVSVENAPQNLRLGMTAVAEIDISGGDARKPAASRPRGN